MKEPISASPVDEEPEPVIEGPSTGSHLEICTWCALPCVMPDASAAIPECVRCRSYGATT